MYKKLSLITYMGVIAQSSLAGTMGPAAADRYYVATISLGPIWTSNVSSQTLYLTPDIEKTFTSGNTSSTLVDGELFLGVQQQLKDAVWGQIGLAVAATNKATFNGDIWDDADPMFNNFVYQYQIQHTHLAAKGKLLLDAGFVLLPWISGSVGVAWNQAQNFTSMPTIYPAIPTPYFTNNTQTAFTYTVGAGVQYAIAQKWQIGIGYEFADWGKVQFGPAADQTMNNGYAVNHVYTNGFLVNLTYLA